MYLQRLLATTMAGIIGLCAISSQAEAIAASVKTFGMAATGVAYPLDALAGAYNPAGHVEIGDRVDVGVHWVHNTGHTRIKDNVLPPFLPNLNGKYPGFRTKDFYAPDFGINKRLGCCNEWAVGLVVYNRNFSKTTYNQPFPLFGTSNAGLEYLHETITPVLAYKLNECHNFGIGVNFMVERLKVNGLENLARSPTPGNPLGSVYPTRVTNKGYNYSTGWSFILGWQWHILDNLTLGLTYQPKTCMHKLDKYKGFLPKGRLDVPPMYSGGIAWNVWDCVTVAFDVQVYQWDQIRALHNPLLHDGTIELLGSKNGPGFGFKNQTFYRFGIDWQLTEELTVRAGFRHANSPIRRSQTVVNQLTLDTVEDFVTAGATYRINCFNEISAYFAYGFRNKIKGKDSIPEGVPFVSPLAPFGFGGGEANLIEQKYALGIAWGYNY